MSNERVTTHVENHVAVVTLNRADKFNALDAAMFEAIIEAGVALKSRKAVRAVVLTHAGDHFCSGLDMSLFQPPAGSTAADSQDDVKPRSNPSAIAGT